MDVAEEAVSQFVHLTEAACWRIGLEPRGLAPAHLYGLVPVKRCQNGYTFEIVELWRWQTAVICWKQWSSETA